MIRDRVVARTRDMLEHLRLQVAMLPETELDVLRCLERPQQFDLVVDVANFVMERLGNKPTAPKDPRFDKSRRALAKQSPKPPRGVPKAKAKGPAVRGPIGSGKSTAAAMAKSSAAAPAAAEPEPSTDG